VLGQRDQRLLQQVLRLVDIAAHQHRDPQQMLLPGPHVVGEVRVDVSHPPVLPARPILP
jgi:hypothetical protein